MKTLAVVDWSNPDEIARDSDVFQKLVFALFGAYVWELFTTCGFEWSLLTKRRKFRMPLGIFSPLIHKSPTQFTFSPVLSLSLLHALVFRRTDDIHFSHKGGRLDSLLPCIFCSRGLTDTQINCKALYTFNSWTGNMTILSASTSLMLRTFALWERRLSIVIPLGMLCVAHWALLYRTMFIVVAQWDPVVKACVVVQTNPSLLNTTFFFTMGFDLIILIITAIALLARHSARTDLWKLLFQDGLVYFILSFSTNCIPAVLNVLDLNTPMNVIATIPAAAVTSMAACRAVMRLLEFNSNDVYIHSISAAMAGSNPPVTIAHHNIVPHINFQKVSRTRPEVRVTTEHITMTEFPVSGTSSPCLTMEIPARSSADVESARHKNLEAFADKDDIASLDCHRHSDF